MKRDIIILAISLNAVCVLGVEFEPHVGGYSIGHGWVLKEGEKEPSLLGVTTLAAGLTSRFSLNNVTTFELDLMANTPRTHADGIKTWHYLFSLALGRYNMIFSKNFGVIGGLSLAQMKVKAKSNNVNLSNGFAPDKDVTGTSVALLLGFKYNMAKRFSFRFYTLTHKVASSRRSFNSYLALGFFL